MGVLLKVYLWVFVMSVITLNVLFYVEEFNYLLLSTIQSILYLFIVFGNPVLKIIRLYCALLAFVSYYLVEQIRDGVCYNLKDSSQLFPCNMFFIIILVIFCLFNFIFLIFIQKHLKLRKINNVGKIF